MKKIGLIKIFSVDDNALRALNVTTETVLLISLVPVTPKRNTVRPVSLEKAALLASIAIGTFTVVRTKSTHF